MLMMDRLVNSMARTLWVCAWADWNDEHKMVPVSGKELMDVAPPTPPRATILAAFLLGRYTRANTDGYESTMLVNDASVADGLDWIEVCQGLHDKWLSNLGHYLVMMALGTGVSWFDDHEHFPLAVPRLEIVVDDFFTLAEWLDTDLYAHAAKSGSGGE